MSKNNSSNSNGLDFFGLLTILFVGLKLTGYITWSWWWVLSPVLFSAGIFLFFTLFLILAAWSETK